MPESLRFATKTQIALQQLQTLLSEGAPSHCVLADAGYGVDTGFRQSLSDMGLLYAVGVTSAVVVWPPGVEPLPPAPYGDILSTLPESISLNDLVSAAYQRWRIERDYQDLKQDFGLGHYEGRGWRGFHHHASLGIAAYAFLMAERLIADKPVGGKKNFAERQVPALPEDYIPRGSPARPATRDPFDHDAAPPTQLRTARPPRPMSLLRPRKQKTIFVTQ